MAVVSVGSISVTGIDGGVKSVALYFPATMSSADITLYMQQFATLLDAAIDGSITRIAATIGITPPGGLKAVPINGQGSEIGALVTFDVAASDYSHSIWFPTWKNAGFAGKTVINTGVYQAVTDAIIAGTVGVATGATSEEGNDLVAYLRGSRKPRK